MVEIYNTDVILMFMPEKKRIKKKIFIEMPRVTDFMASQSQEINDEYQGILRKLEEDGHLSMPFGEKIPRENLFAIRVINAGNVRIFYVYGTADRVYGISAYEKKTQTIPLHELKLARKIVRLLKQGGLI